MPKSPLYHRVAGMPIFSKRYIDVMVSTHLYIFSFQK